MQFINDIKKHSHLSAFCRLCIIVFKSSFVRFFVSSINFALKFFKSRHPLQLYLLKYYIKHMYSLQRVISHLMLFIPNII